MAQGFETSGELDRMKADAIKRARQMHLRAANFPQGNIQEKQKEDRIAPKSTNTNSNFSKNGILEMIRVLGFENDQLILIALILMLSPNEENFPLVLALLYIAL